MIEERRTGTVVVGSGPGGATVARELARNGEEVLLLEKGRDHQWPVGSILAYATMYDIRKSEEGIIVRRGITTGGSTMLYSANCYDPPPFLLRELGIDLSSEVAETKEELHVKPIPEYFYKDYVGTKRLVEAADALGYSMKPQDRFIDPQKCDPHCDSCLFGCRKGAKWTAREYISDAVRFGTRLITRCDVEKVIYSGQKVEGVLAKTPKGTLRILANRVVLAAGGFGTPIVLQKSGFGDAGKHFFMDPMSVLVGVMREGKGTFHEMTFTFADESHIGEFVIGNAGAVNGFAAQIIKLKVPYLWRAIQMKRMAGMFVKLCDEPSGSVGADGSFHKALTPRDERVMAKGVEIARNIMIKAGVDPATISVAKGVGAHPGGTAAIGRVVGTDLQTKISNFYVCDNSVMPVSGGIPPVLTLVSLGKKLARTLCKTSRQPAEGLGAHASTSAAA
jgi:choline dehydrogenase-like flavoprotein